MTRLISEIARDIQREWLNISPAARPYLQAMLTLSTKADKYVFDSAEDIVLRFLCNASSFKGEAARVLKQQLKDAIK